MRKNPLFITNFKDIDNDYLSSEPEYLKPLMRLIEHNIHIPDGFIISSNAFEFFIKKARIHDKISMLLSTTHFERPDSVMQVSGHLKRIINETTLPPKLENEISQEFYQLIKKNDRVELTINQSIKIISSYESLLEKIKEIWSNQFEAKNLFMRKETTEKANSGSSPILVQKFYGARTKGKLYTASLSIDSHTKLNKNQIYALEELGKKIHKIFYLPQEVDWMINDNQVVVMSIRPQTDV